MSRATAMLQVPQAVGRYRTVYVPLPLSKILFGMRVPWRVHRMATRNVSPPLGCWLPVSSKASIVNEVCSPMNALRSPSPDIRHHRASVADVRFAFAPPTRSASVSAAFIAFCSAKLWAATAASLAAASSTASSSAFATTTTAFWAASFADLTVWSFILLSRVSS